MAEIHFGTDGWRAIIGEDFTNDNLVRVIDAAARVFKEDAVAAGRPADAPGTLIVGHDCRQDAHAYAQLAAEVAAAQSFRVLLTQDYCPTPTLCWSVAQDADAVGGIMLTSSHNPAEYLGVKLRMADGGAAGKEFTDRVEAVLPDAATAEKYIAQGALWNGGVFAYKLRYVLDKAHELIDFTDYKDLFDKYETLKKISFDYAVVENESQIQVMRFAGQWKDMGTWNTLTEAMEEPSIGKAMLNDTCQNVHVLNELDVPVLCMGLKDVVVSASPEGILVSDKEQSSYIKPYVDSIHQQIMFAEKSWGSFRVLDVEDASMTIKITLTPGHGMNYHSHENRDEVWTVISGTGHAILDGVRRDVKAGDILTMPAGCRHTVFADSELKIIEVQLGPAISVEDKQKYPLPQA